MKDSEIKKLAKLAAISITDDELDKYRNEIGGIVEWVNELKEVDTSKVEPLYSVVHKEKIEVREDIAVGASDDILMNSKHVRSRCFVVPKVISS